MIRRDVIRIGVGLGVPGLAALRAWAGSSKDFYNSKPPAEWTKSEIQDLMNRSPWAKEVNVSENGANVDYSRQRPSGGNSTGLPAGLPGLPSGPPMGKPFVPQDGIGRFRATVRWDSALPIREAMRIQPSKDYEQNYIIAVSGDLPDTGHILGADSATLDERRLESVKQYTRLERKGDSLLLSRMATTPDSYPSVGGTLFYFKRADANLAEEKLVTFVTRVGPYEVKARFNVKDMLYRGKLEL